MFNREEREDREEVVTTQQSDSADTVIGSTVTVEGNLKCDDTILIDGKFIGTIQTSKHITIGPDAKVEGDLQASAVYMAGMVKGNITATDTMELSSTAKLHGDLQTKTISIQKGAVVDGQCHVGQTEDASSVKNDVHEPHATASVQSVTSDSSVATEEATPVSQ